MQSTWQGMEDRCPALASFLYLYPVLPTTIQPLPDTMRLLWCEHGHAQINFAGREITIGASHMLLISAKTRVTLSATQGNTQIGELDISFAKPAKSDTLCVSLLLRDPAFAHLVNHSFSVHSLQDSSGVIACLLDIMKRNSPYDVESASVSQTLCLNTLLLAIAHAAGMTPQPVSSDHVAHVLRFIQEHYSEDLSLPVIAADAHLHVNYLHRIFSSEMHCSLAKYLQNYRIERAKEMLINTQMSIKAVANACGLPNQQQFSRIFREQCDVSPSAFRDAYNISCSYANIRSHYGVINYAEPNATRPGQEPMRPLGDPLYLSEDYVPLVKAYYNRADMFTSTTDVTDHAHSLFEIMFVRKGHIEVVVQDTHIIVYEGQYIWLNAGVRHSLTLDPDTFTSVVNIEYALAPSTLPVLSTRQMAKLSPEYEDLLRHAPSYTVQSDPNGILDALLRQNVFLADSTYPMRETLCASLTQQIMLAIAMQHQSRRPSIPALTAASPAPDAMLQVIAAQYASPVTVNSLAKSCGVSTTRLQQIVRRATGMSVTEYLQHVRIEKAKELLLSGVSPEECAELVGYASFRYFSQLFHRTTGMTPAAFCAQNA